MSIHTLRICLLGELDLHSGETSLPPLESARAESLLAYLVLKRETPQPRQRLAFLLWPDSTEVQARTNLRHVLHNLRRSLPDPDRFLEVSPRTLQWRADSPAWLDVAAFESALARSERQAVGNLALLREAVDLYRGDLLEACYDEWILEQRERLRQRFLEALERLTALLEARGDYAEAIRYAERLLRHDPLHEATYRLLMHLHDARGDRARALRVYHVCTATLERELGVEPAAATRAVYETLLRLERQLPITEQPGRVVGSALVGRALEFERLKALWGTVERKGARFVLVTGEAGIGKTRLVDAFHTWCAHRGAITAEARAYPAEGALAYAPVVAWLRSEALKLRLNKLDPARLTDLARLLPELLSELPGLARPEPLPESDLRSRLFDAVARAIFTAGGPLLLVADDIHWCDRETLRLLHYLLRVEPKAPLLVAATVRCEDLDDQHPLHDLIAGLQVLERFTEIPLERLTREETSVLARRLTSAPLGEQAMDQLYQETEGNPLFVVEAMRAGWQSGDHKRGQLSAKVQAVINSRLAQLSGPARDLVGVAATIGHAFSAQLLANASEVDEDTLVRSLDELWRRHVFREQGSAAYDFSHDKIREAAYLGLSPAMRRHYHLRVAHSLEHLYADDPGPVSAQVAAHYDRAGCVSEAITWYERAAEVAQRLHANTDAVRLLERALQLLSALPEVSERQARELDILTTLLVPLVTVEGYRSSRMTQVQQRALDLARARAVEPEPPLLRSLALASLSQGDFELAQGIGERLRARGEREGDQVLLVEGEYVLGIAAFWQAEFEAARRHFEASIYHYRPQHRGAHLLRYGQDPKVICLGRLGLTLWFLGRAEAATAARDAALALADEIGHPISLAVALLFSALLSLELHDHKRLREDVARAVVLRAGPSTLIQIPNDALSGYVDVLDGRDEAGIARIQRALDDARGARSAPGIEAFLVRLLLAACATAGAARTGLMAAERALTIPDGARLWEAEAHRLRAEFLAALGGPANEVEAEIERALQVAHRQGAPALALRAAVSLVRYRLACGDGPRTSEAYRLLTAIVDAVPEGRDTPDLREAAAILA